MSVSQNMFGTAALEKVEQAAVLAEELVSNYYKMSSSQWLKSKYGIKTAKDLVEAESVDGPFAQVVKYEGRRNDALLKSCVFNFWTICLQDKAIIKAVEKDKELSLFPFLLYILVHELIHIVRFSKFQQMYEKSSEINLARDEEKRVDRITWHILSGVPGMGKVLEYHKKWRTSEI